MNNILKDRFDLNEDGEASEEEILRSTELLELQLREEKAEAQKKIAWASFTFFCVYALLPLLPFIPLERINIISSMSDLVFISAASIVGFFFGATAYMSK